VITDAEHTNNLIVNAFHREMEVYGYQVNIDNYTTMLAGLPNDAWPEPIAAWASTEISNLPSDMSDADVSLVSDYQYRDKLRALLRTERVEQGKAVRVLNALKSQIGSNADEAILAYKSSQSSGV